MKRIKTPRNREREEQILEAAREVFQQKGFRGTTTLEIARKADISEVTLFRYFTSKKEIYNRAIEPLLFKALEDIIDENNSLSVYDKLEKILLNRIQLISKYPDLVKLVLFEDHLQSEADSQNMMQKILELITKELQQIDLSEEKRNFIKRLIVGSILSFLFLPESNPKEIQYYVDEVITFIRNNN